MVAHDFFMACDICACILFPHPHPGDYWCVGKHVAIACKSQELKRKGQPTVHLCLGCLYSEVADRLYWGRAWEFNVVMGQQPPGELCPTCTAFARQHVETMLPIARQHLARRAAAKRRAAPPVVPPGPPPGIPPPPPLPQANAAPQAALPIAAQPEAEPQEAAPEVQQHQEDVVAAVADNAGKGAGKGNNDGALQVPAAEWMNVKRRLADLYKERRGSTGTWGSVDAWVSAASTSASSDPAPEEGAPAHPSVRGHQGAGPAANASNSSGAGPEMHDMYSDMTSVASELQSEAGSWTHMQHDVDAQFPRRAPEQGSAETQQ